MSNHMVLHEDYAYYVYQDNNIVPVNDSSNFIFIRCRVKGKVKWQGFTPWKSPLRRIIQPAPKCTHQQLDGFSGLPIDFEFVLYLLENAVMLEKITIKPDYRYPTKGWPKQVALMEEAVRHLQTKVPQGVELIVNEEQINYFSRAVRSCDQLLNIN